MDMGARKTCPCNQEATGKSAGMKGMPVRSGNVNVTAELTSSAKCVALWVLRFKLILTSSVSYH